MLWEVAVLGGSMKKWGWTHIVAVVLAGIAALDLTTGGTNKPILPAFIGNYLTQQIDIVLLAIAGFMFFFV